MAVAEEGTVTGTGRTDRPDRAAYARGAAGVGYVHRSALAAGPRPERAARPSPLAVPVRRMLPSRIPLDSRAYLGMTQLGAY